MAMQRSTSSKITAICRQILRTTMQPPQCDVFINHCGIDTKKNVAGLLYDHLRGVGLHPFLDCKNMKPGDRLFDKINAGVRQCKVGIAVFSPMYCHSYFCLYELSLMIECKKRIVPIFCDVEPSELRVNKDYGSCPDEVLDKFRLALEEAKYTLGIAFDRTSGDWPELLENAADMVKKSLIEVKEEEL